MQAIINAILNSNNTCITFKDFMEIALYHPEQGYYSKTVKKIGKEGDFYTSSSVHPIFAKVLTSFFHSQILANNLQPLICEIGGGEGRFAQELLDEWKEKYPEVYTKLKYIIIEKSPYHQNEIHNKLKEHKCYQIFSDLKSAMDEYPNMEGIIFSNELLDAFPVHLVEQREEQLFEVYVTIAENNELKEILIPCEDDSIKEWLVDHKINLNTGQRYEIPLQMMDWISEMNKWIIKGLLVTIDYGYKNEEWSRSEHREGSIRGYYKHQLVRNPLLNPGEMDLTTHIHLDPLIKSGQELGLECLYENTQLEFLLSAGILSFLQDNYDPNPFSEKSKMNRAIRTFITPGEISSSFHVIIQGKKITKLEWQDPFPIPNK